MDAADLAPERKDGRTRLVAEDQLEVKSRDRTRDGT